MLTAYAVSHWWDDPYSLGAWSGLRVGAGPGVRALLGQPVSARLMLAGEYTNPEQAGMTHGAYEEGVRAAQAMLAAGHRRVAVVGAGFAGLGAAAKLAAGGADVKVLEARQRIGGRAHTTVLGETPVELGANWLQQGARNSLRAIASGAGLELVETDFHAPLDLGPAGRLAGPDLGAMAEEFRQWLGRMPGADTSMAVAVADWMGTAPGHEAARMRAMVDFEILLDSGIPLADTSARHSWEPGVGAGDAWLPAGYGRLQRMLAQGLDIRLGSEVNVIADTGGEVRLSGPRLEETVEAVIVCVPAAVLRAGRIAFDPPLPAGHQAALSQLATGRVEKLSLEFDERWWPVSPSGYLRMAGPRDGMVAEWLDMTETAGRPVITGIFAGDWAAQIWSAGDDAAIAQGAASALEAA
ncbi:MAG: FAD-dependent oxidoreductase, partial [Anderseniella sp.]|nr:FAD-dependent oxidoreductase [Anderseniella sp.]